MLTFKQFLLEDSDGLSPSYTQVDLVEIADLLKTKCSDALWMLDKNSPKIWRGDRHLTTLKLIDREHGAVADPTKTTRKTKGGFGEQYSRILDNNPFCKGFPKRTKSFIASTNKTESANYGVPYITIPFNDVPIGLTKDDDIWFTSIKIFGMKIDLHDFDECLNLIEPKINSIDDLKKIDELLKNRDETTMKSVNRAFRYHSDFHKLTIHPDTFLKDIWKAFSPESTGFKLVTTKDAAAFNVKTEVWIGGPCLFLDPAVLDSLNDILGI